MKTPFRPGFATHPKAMNWFLSAVWGLIIAKCIVVWWAMLHWHVPFHPLWIVVPTLVFAGTATLLWLVHTDE